MRKTIKLRVEKPSTNHMQNAYFMRSYEMRLPGGKYIPYYPDELEAMFGRLPAKGEVFDLELELKTVRRVR